MALVLRSLDKLEEQERQAIRQTATRYRDAFGITATAAASCTENAP